MKELRASADAEERRCCPPHPGFLEGVCILCGRQEREGDDVSTMIALAYVHKTLKLCPEAMDALRRVSARNLITTQRKLTLVLDLDHTLLHTTALRMLSSDEEYLLESSIVGLHRIDSMGMITKLRPFVRPFLEEASDLFEMYVYTMSRRVYAHEMVKLLDPGQALFGSRVIAREDCTLRGQKGLDVVLTDERLVVVLDDTVSVWRRHTKNLIRMRSYDFFASKCHRLGLGDKSFAEARMDESDGLLRAVLDVLRRVHQMVFDPVLGVDLSCRDVGRVLEKMRREVLRGCRIVFPSDCQPILDPDWLMALQLGATCSVGLGSSATHVVWTCAADTDRACWAVRHDKFLVTPDWIEAAYYLWRRPSEEEFLAVDSLSSASTVARACSISANHPENSQLCEEPGKARTWRLKMFSFIYLGSCNQTLFSLINEFQILIRSAFLLILHCFRFFVWVFVRMLKS